jgi:hypothetical protein
MTVYSAESLSGSFQHPDVGVYMITGPNVGRGAITISMSTERSEHSVAADGSVMVSYIAGDNGTVTIEAQQTSSIHSFLLNWFNFTKTSADNGDPSNWAAASIILFSITDGVTHTITGISPQKVPDKSYAASGGMVTWTLMAASSITR